MTSVDKNTTHFGANNISKHNNVTVVNDLKSVNDELMFFSFNNIDSFINYIT